MSLSFERLCLLTAAIFAGLSATMLLAPGLLTWVFGLESALAGLVMLRRCGVIFAALALLLVGLRDLPVGPHRKTLAQAMAVLAVGLVLLGLGELILGRVGPGILIAVATEAALAALFARHMRA